MDRHSLWAAIRRFWVLVLVVAVAGMALGAYFELSKQSAYIATIRVFANSGQADSVQVSQSTSLALQRMDSYVQLADSTRFADRLVSRLDLTIPPSVLAGRISANLEKDTVIMQVSVGGASREEAERIAEVLPSEYTSFVNQLVDTTSTAKNRVTFTTIDGPRVRKSSSVTKLALSTVFGLGIGSALGLAGALAWSRRSARRSPEALSELTGTAVVGIIPNHAHSDSASLWIADMDESQRLASHRLARNLPYLGAGTHGLIVVTATTRGSGATHVALGLAGALAQRGQRVLVVDAAFSGTALSDILEVEVLHPVTEVIGGSASLDTAVLEVEQPLRVDFLSYGGKQGMGMTPEERRRESDLYDQLRSQYDSIIVDAAPVLARAEVPIALEYADAVLLVVDQSRHSPRETRAASDALLAMSSTPTGLVVNRAAIREIPHQQVMSGVVLPGRSSDVG